MAFYNTGEGRHITSRILGGLEKIALQTNEVFSGFVGGAMLGGSLVLFPLGWGVYLYRKCGGCMHAAHEAYRESGRTLEMLEESAQRKGVSLTEEVNAYVTHVKNERQKDFAYTPPQQVNLSPLQKVGATVGAITGAVFGGSVWYDAWHAAERGDPVLLGLLGAVNVGTAILAYWNTRTSHREREV